MRPPKDDTPPPEPDRAPGAPHPRMTARLIGQDAAETDFLDAFHGGRLHHAWLITGPRGVGKATLAWRIARFLLSDATDPGTLDVPRDTPLQRRIDALSESRLALLRRPWDAKTDRLKQDITVEEVRRLKSFFGLSAADGGRRVVIVDPVDEMNTSAANALLKLLEEPPADTVMLLIAHQPARLLPTILSRCRNLRCAALSETDMTAALTQAGAPVAEDGAALAELAQGSVGAAIRLTTLDGLALYRDITGLFAGGLNRPAALKLADSATGRTAADRFELMLDLFDLFLARLARSGVAGPPATQAAPGEARLLQALSPDATAARRWAELAQDLNTRSRHGRAVNLDPAVLILDMVLKIHETAARASV